MPSFSKAEKRGRNPLPATLLQELQTTTAQLRRLTVLRNRLDAARAREDTRQWVQDRRARTRHLIELGGLVQKAGLIDLVDDDRATLLGAFLEIAAQLQQDGQPEEAHAANLRARWRRRGLRAFEADKDASAAMGMRKEEQQPEKDAQR
jgi:hypothetical protein